MLWISAVVKLGDGHQLLEARSPLWCGAVSPDSSVLTALLWAYFASKLYEGKDLLIVSARGYPIHSHFRYHHYTTPLFAWVGLQSRSAHGLLFLVLNTVMHVFVCTFLSGYQPPWLKLLLRRWQWVQLGGGFITACLALLQRVSGAPCTESAAAGGGTLVAWAADVVPPLLFAMYACLFLKELADEAAAAGAKKE